MRANCAGVAGARQGVVCSDPGVGNSALFEPVRAERTGLEFAAPEQPLRSIASSSQASGRAASGLNAEESLIEFRELVSSAGAEVVAELMQRRSRLDPA
ncbi:MAG: hypothetical protein ABR898_10890, partial [Terracidiphilus sp.]